MVVLTRKEKEELVLEIYFNQNKNYRQIPIVIIPIQIK
jgi:hypothetical protein